MATPSSILTGLNPFQPLEAVATDDGQLFCANGIDSVRRWDGQAAAAVLAGVAAPATALVMTGAVSLSATTLVNSAGGLEPRQVVIDVASNQMFATYSHASWNRIRKGALDGSGWTDVVLSAGTPEDLAIDFASGLMYWSAPGAGRIRRATTAGASVTDLVTTTSPRGLALDLTNGFMYWVGDTGTTIKRANLNGGDQATILSGLTNAYGLAIDVTGGQLYYTTTSPAALWRVDTTGANNTQVANGFGTAVYVELDMTNRVAYVSQGNAGSIIYRCDLNGSNLSAWITGLSGPYGMKLDSSTGRMYFCAYAVNNIQRVSARPIDGKYIAYSRFLDAQGNPSALSPVSEEATIAGASQINFTSVPVPAGGSNVVKRQILRNTNGQSVTVYVDVETTDLASTSFSSTRSDSELFDQEPVALFDESGASLVNAYGIARTDKPVLFPFSGRLFLAGEVVYDKGSLVLTSGSPTVTGVQTDFVAGFVGRFLRVKGQSTSYEISAVGSATGLTLLSNYSGASGLFEYEIRSAPAERLTYYFSGSGQPTGWDTADGISVPQPGDTITGMLDAGSFLYLLLERSVYRLTYDTHPGRDGRQFLAVRRGCVNQRCWVQFGAQTFILDRQGVYLFDGGNDQDVSAPIQTLFQRPNDDGIPRINWARRRFFHACVDTAAGVVRFFVALGNCRYPQHALAFRVTTQEWSIEEYPFPVACSTNLTSTPAYPILGSSARRLLVLGGGQLDVTNGKLGSTRVPVTAATYLSVSYDSATYVIPTADVVGAPLVVTKGRGKGQLRTIVSASGGVLTVKRPFNVLPDATSEVQIGGIPWTWRSRRFYWDMTEQNTPRQCDVLFRPADGSLDLRLYESSSTTPTNAGLDLASDGVRVRRGDPDYEIDLATVDGQVQCQFDEATDRRAPGSNDFTLELRGVGATRPLRIRRLVVAGSEEGQRSGS
ncbi:MAG: hypothetical protein U0836_18230 [Pirellulales bacterium]